MTRPLSIYNVNLTDEEKEALGILAKNMPPENIVIARTPPYEEGYPIRMNFKNSTKDLLEGNESWLNLGMIIKFIFRSLFRRLDFLERKLMSEIVLLKEKVDGVVTTLQSLDTTLDSIKAKVDELQAGSVDITQLEGLKESVNKAVALVKSVDLEATEIKNDESDPEVTDPPSEPSSGGAPGV